MPVMGDQYPGEEYLGAYRAEEGRWAARVTAIWSVRGLGGRGGLGQDAIFTKNSEGKAPTSCKRLLTGDSPNGIIARDCQRWVAPRPTSPMLVDPCLRLPSYPAGAAHPSFTFWRL